MAEAAPEPAVAAPPPHAGQPDWAQMLTAMQQMSVRQDGLIQTVTQMSQRQDGLIHSVAQMGQQISYLYDHYHRWEPSWDAGASSSAQQPTDMEHEDDEQLD